MVHRPSNHVTESLRSGFKPPKPFTPRDLVGLREWLVTTFPPRCRRPSEAELEHQHYAGKAELAGELAAILQRMEDHLGANPALDYAEYDGPDIPEED